VDAEQRYVPGKAWVVGVRLQRVDIADRPRGVGEVRLADDQQRSLRHRAPVNGFHSGDRLVEGRAEMDGASVAGSSSADVTGTPVPILPP
jgi:hypothetical protein